MTPFRIRERLKKLLFSSKPTTASKPAPVKYAVRFVLPDGTDYTTHAKAGDSLVLASGRGPAPIATGCSDSSCGTCQVEVLAGADQLTPPTDAEEKTKRETKVEDHLRLGCQAGVLGPGVEVRIINVFGEEPNVDPG
jgi:ferredoxin